MSIQTTPSATDNTDLGNLTTKAMLAKLSISTWTASKKEKRIVDDAAFNYSADADRLKANKALVAKAALEDIQQCATAAREFHRTRTRPWFDDPDSPDSAAKGRRILPAKLYQDYAAKMTEHRQEFEDKVKDFLVNYPVYIEAARTDLGALFDEKDYPPQEEIAAKFKFKAQIEPLPTGNDFRVDLGAEETARIVQDIDQRLKDGVGAAMRDLWQQVADAVGSMRDKLNAYEPADKNSGKKASGVFRDSLVENLREIVDLLPAMNITGDGKLEKLRQELAESLLDGVTAQDLREDDVLRERTANKADELLKTMEGYF